MPYEELGQLINRVSPGYKPPNRKLEKLQKVLLESFNLICPKEELQETRNLMPGNRQLVYSQPSKWKHMKDDVSTRKFTVASEHIKEYQFCTTLP